MIARMWHGVTDAAKSDEYFDYLKQTGVPDYQTTEGNCGVFVLRRIEEDKAHFLLLSLWESVESIEKFAGGDIKKATYYPADEKFLLELEPHVQHFEILIKP